MPNIGRIGEFDVGQPQSWDIYAEQLKYYLEANDIIIEGKKRATLLAVCGTATLSIVKALVYPQTPSDKSFDELTALLQQHFTPKPSEIYERFHYQQRLQRENEGIATYATELRRMAENCNFGPTLSERLRDQLVCGMRNEELQRRLLARTDLTFDIVLKDALAAEAAAGQSRDIQAGAASITTMASAHQVFRKKISKSASSSGTGRIDGKGCAGCGGNHSRASCRFKDTECSYCFKRGHIERACWSKRDGAGQTPSGSRFNFKKKNATNAVHEDRDECETSDESDTANIYIANAIHSIGSSTQKKIATVWLQGKPCSMEVDSGSDFTIISDQTFHKLWPGGGPTVTPLSTRLIDFQRHPVQMKGECNVTVRYGNKQKELRLFIAQGNRTSLLGLEWFRPLGISLIGVHHMDPDPIEDVVREFQDIFEEGLGTYNGPLVSLQLDPSVVPIQMKPRRVPLALLPKIEFELDRLTREGVLEATSETEWATPLVPVIKPNGDVRLCADYKCTINKALSQHPYPIPAVNRLLTKQAGGGYYAKIDLANAYLQLRVDDAAAKAQTIITHRGAYKVKRLQFGVSTAPGIFQSLMEEMFRNIQGVTPYFDDVLIKGKNPEELSTRLREVFKILRNAGLRARKEKCLWGVTSIDFLGFRLDSNGIRPTEAKIKAIQEAPPPKDRRELQAFLGLLNFYHTFLKGKATVAEPLHRLLDKDREWEWGTEHDQAFSAVKALLSSETVLVHFDEKKPIILTCDASPYGIGAVLGHVMENNSEAPVAFYSRTMSPTERNYAQIDREALAVIAGVKKFHDFLYGHRFTIITDHKPLLGLFSPIKATPQILSPRMLRWSQLLGAYNFDIQYQPGSSIEHADALSRLPLQCSDFKIPPLAEVFFLESLPDPPLVADEIARITSRDPLLSRVLNWVLRGWSSKPSDAELEPFWRRQHELSVHKGCLLWGNRVVIPAKGRQRVLEELHLCHPGIVRMKALARSYVWWPHLDNDISDRVSRCSVCQEARHAMPKAPVHPWEVTRSPWSRVHMDFAGPFQGKTFLIIVDSFSKWLEVITVNSMSAQTVIRALRVVFATHGLPDTVVSDNGPQFTSSELAGFMEQNLIRHVTVAPYHPSSNGQAERMVQTTKDALKRITNGDWEQRISNFLLTQHVTPCTSTGYSPAELLMGRRLKTCLDHLHPDLARVRQEKQEDIILSHGSTPRKFQTEEPVYVRNYGAGPHWIPATVTEPTGPVSYRAVTDQGQLVRRHVDQMFNRVSSESASPQDHAITDNGVSKEPSVVTAEAAGTGSPNKQCVSGTQSLIVNPETPRRPQRQKTRPRYLLDYTI